MKIKILYVVFSIIIADHYLAYSGCDGNHGYVHSNIEMLKAIANINQSCCFGDKITFFDMEGNEYVYINPTNRGENCPDLVFLKPKPVRRV